MPRVGFLRFTRNAASPSGNDGEEGVIAPQGGKTEFAEADRISRTFHRRYDNRVGYLLHHLTVHPEHEERRAGGENPIGKFLSVTGPRNGVAGAAAATSISPGSDCDDGGGDARCERGAYKLHTITLSQNSAAHVSSQDCTSIPSIDLFNVAVYSVEERGKKKKREVIESDRVIGEDLPFR